MAKKIKKKMETGNINIFDVTRPVDSKMQYSLTQFIKDDS